jgi:hypothetical protein
MRAGPILFRVTSAVLVLQLLFGGLLTFGFISVEAHEVAGFVLFILAIATMGVWLTTKPSLRSMRVLTVVIASLFCFRSYSGSLR